MNSQDLKIGSIIEVKNAMTKQFEEKVITRVSDNFVWFKNSGLNRIKKTTFENWPTLYRIKSI